jgi:exopolyphosphatase/guanosine-5'-triphosphate,3'-diphosphate pyrophosphatase
MDRNWEHGLMAESELQDTWGEPSASRDKAKLRVAVLDLGSTSFHLLVSDASASAELERVTRQRKQLRLGAFLNGAARIPEDSCARAIEAARELKTTSDACRPDRMLAVATAALRDAENGAELVARIEDAIGTPVRMLSGEQEARLIFSAFRHRLRCDGEPMLGADLGGGSLELAIGDDCDVHWETTLRLGVTSLHGEFVRRDPMSRRERNAVRARVRDFLAPHLETISQSQVRRCVASGGTVRVLARLITEMPESLIRWRGEKPRLRVRRRQLERLTDMLVESTHDERLEMRGVKRDRADLLPTGALILLTMLEACGIKELVACDWGLREGVVLEAVGLASAGAR